GEYDDSERHLREALRANAALGRAGRPALDAEANHSLGVLYIHAPRHDDAVTVLRQAPGDLMNRTPHLAWGNLGWAYLEQGDHAQAEQALTQAVQLQPRFCGGWYRLGRVHFTLGADAERAAAGSGQARFESAEGALTHALEV